MISNKYEQAKVIINQGDGDFDGPKSEKLVQKAEKALDVKFPPSYRMFVSEFGCGDIYGKEFYGLVDDNFTSSSIPNAIWLTLNERRSIGLDRRYILVGEAGDGSYFAIDLSVKDEKEESPVVVVSARGVEISMVADSFEEYLFDSLKSAVS